MCEVRKHFRVSTIRIFISIPRALFESKEVFIAFKSERTLRWSMLGKELYRDRDCTLCLFRRCTSLPGIPFFVLGVSPVRVSQREASTFRLVIILMQHRIAPVLGIGEERLMFAASLVFFSSIRQAVYASTYSLIKGKERCALTLPAFRDDEPKTSSPGCKRSPDRETFIFIFCPMYAWLRLRIPWCPGILPSIIFQFWVFYSVIFFFKFLLQILFVIFCLVLVEVAQIFQLPNHCFLFFSKHFICSSRYIKIKSRKDYIFFFYWNYFGICEKTPQHIFIYNFLFDLR